MLSNIVEQWRPAQVEPTDRIAIYPTTAQVLPGFGTRFTLDELGLIPRRRISDGLLELATVEARLALLF